MDAWKNPSGDMQASAYAQHGMSKWRLYINATVTIDCEPEYINSHESLEDAVKENRRQYQVAVEACKDPEVMPPISSVPADIPQEDHSKCDHAFFKIPEEDTTKNFIYISKTPDEVFFVIRDGTPEEEESYLYDL